MSGTYLQEDLRPGAQCRVMSERTYSGSGTLFTTWHTQLNPATDQGKGIAELHQFVPEWDNNLGLTPGFDGEVVGNSTRTSYYASDGECVENTVDVGHWFSPRWGGTQAPGTVVTSEQGRGVQFDYKYSHDGSDAETTDTYETHIVGSLLPTSG